MSTEKSPKPVVDPGSNLAPLKKKIAEAYEEITNLKKTRGAVGANITAALTSLEAEGIGKDPMRLAMKYVGMTDDQRKGFDIAYQVAREALGAPVQGDLLGG